MALPTRMNRTTQYDPLVVTQREFNSILGQLFGGRERESGSLAPYGVDVREDPNHIYVEAELPGFKNDEVNVILENQTLTISAERKNKSPDNNADSQHLLRERRYTSFQRSFTLPLTVDEQSVNAALNDGILTITLNKREESKPRKIKVS